MFALTAAALVALSCKGGGDSYDGGGGGSPINPSPTPDPNVVTIEILREAGAQSFRPNPAQAGGRTVVFRNTDSIVHRVRLNDGTIDTGNIAPGATSAAVTMPMDGTNYHCSLHTTMVGAVNPASGQPPPPCNVYCDDDEP
jgi:plastocyanin